jgi:hypothetical protein
MRENNLSRFAPALLVALLAAVLRFHDLGAWPYSGDETASLHEEDVLFHGVQVAHASQAYRLPHLIPLSYLALHLSHVLFGGDEWGTRVVVALLGVLSVVLVYWLLDGPLSRPVAIVAAVLVALLPQHVLHSQETRFYMVATCFSFATLLTGARILQSHGTFYPVLSAGAALAAVLTHTLLIVLLPLVCVALYIASYAQGRSLPRATWIVFAAAAAGLALLVALYIQPLVRGWNAHESWGYSVGHAMLASAVMVGVPLGLLSIVGVILLLHARSPQGYYWTVCYLAWAGASVALPLVIPYHAEYVFPLVLAALVAAAYAIVIIYQLLREIAPPAAYAWLGLSCLANLPALASHYVDGSRWNFRDAAAYVRSSWEAGDRVVSDARGLFDHYAAGCCVAAIPMAADSVAELADLVAHGGRLWVVLESTRSGLDSRVQRWLFDCAVHKLSVGGRRFDDAQFSVEVYLAPAPAPECARASPHRGETAPGR